MVPPLPLKIWLCRSCLTLWQQQLKSTVWKIKLSSWRRLLEILGKLPWQDLRMFQVLKLSSFIQKTVSARYKSCKWPLRLGTILMWSLSMETLTMPKRMSNICSTMLNYVKNWQPTSYNFHQLTLWISAVWYLKLFITYMPTRNWWRQVKSQLEKKSTSLFQQGTLEISWQLSMPNKSVFQLENWSVRQMKTMSWQTSSKHMSMIRNVSLRWPLAHRWIFWSLQTWNAWFSTW